MIYLTKRDPVKNMARFYALDVQPTLFGEWVRKIIESAQPFSSKMHSRFHRRCTLIFMTAHTQGAVLRAHARVDIGV